MYEEAMEQRKRRINALLSEWAADASEFADAHPDIQISISRGRSPMAGALRSIAEFVMRDNDRFGWDIVEGVDGSAHFIITSVR